MSLSVYLTSADQVEQVSIFIREDGQSREIGRAEWNERFGGDPFAISTRNYVYRGNITHNLSRVAVIAGVYKHIWFPEELGIAKAAQLIEPLRAGLALLKSDPDLFNEFAPDNGWRTYTGLMQFIEAYLAACEQYPDAAVSVRR